VLKGDREQYKIICNSTAKPSLTRPAWEAPAALHCYVGKDKFSDSRSLAGRISLDGAIEFSRQLLRNCCASPFGCRVFRITGFSSSQLILSTLECQASPPIHLWVNSPFKISNLKSDDYHIFAMFVVGNLQLSWLGQTRNSE